MDLWQKTKMAFLLCLSQFCIKNSGVFLLTAGPHKVFHFHMHAIEAIYHPLLPTTNTIDAILLASMKSLIFMLFKNFLSCQACRDKKAIWQHVASLCVGKV